MVDLDRMAVVGVKGGMSALPAIVINGNDRRTEVFPEELPINGETIGGFIAGFLKGKVRGAGERTRAEELTRRVSALNAIKCEETETPSTPVTISNEERSDELTTQIYSF